MNENGFYYFVQVLYYYCHHFLFLGYKKALSTARTLFASSQQPRQDTIVMKHVSTLEIG
jgi:hypothetical protein